MPLGGTITGEHGVGRLKRPWLEGQLGPEVMELNRRIKAALDSNERPMQPPEKRSKDAVFYIGCSDVELAYQELTDRGLKAEHPKVASYGLKLFSVEDPDGYTIVFQEVP